MTTTHDLPSTNRMTIGLWSAQAALAGLYGMVGFMKLTQPIPELAAMMGWPGVMPEAVVRFVGLAELAGAAGLILPMLTGILPRLTVLAALGLVLLQLSAMVLHVSRGEFEVLPVNLVLLGLAAFVAWGRGKTLGVFG
jgi:hypothetical protein